MYYLPYNKKLKTNSRKLRSHSTLSEVLLWNQLKQGKMMGYQFNRQKPLHHYIVDFYCKQLNLVIEVDDSSHNDPDIAINDIERQRILESMGLKFLRFTDSDVKHRMGDVLRAIVGFIKEHQRQIPLDPPL